MSEGGRDDEGMILVNVLLFVAIASGVLLLMITSEDSALERASRMREAARAMAIARGGEVSAVVALRRDAVVAPDSDSRAEPWGALSESGAPIEGGSFDLAIADAQDRFNINALMQPDPVAAGILGRIAGAVGMSEEQAAKATAAIRAAGPVSDLRPLGALGLPPGQLARLSGLVTALPYDSRINLNAASEDMLAVLTGDAMAARRIVATRERQGFVTAADLATLNVSMPQGAGLTSNLFWVRSRVRIGDTSQQLTSLIARKDTPDGGGKQAVVVGRWVGASAPVQAPRLP
ncbi:general secretion pathway protein GspK [Rhizorhabdus dicambivorans]|uniref:Type II secretion system protein K n=1 Tax=Rhizorhabdus dicambivorans TaxID=1850238 RepID=A0A2A4FRN1_9SPHN|nr:type II secretion system protein GspK [Rhizorhabdus dicambivorans]ATE63541.1 Type II secretory pathway component PulK-like protein [Rhizorhabdus dicambivorans]PCE41405.1 Type II secretory pathway component PulK-like protein [Rhizorhabdus dicambivorans]